MAAIAELTVRIPRCCPTINFYHPGTPFWGKYDNYRSDTPFRYSTFDVPKLAFLSSNHKAIADFVAIDGRLSMCREAYEIIESLEPGVHQFIPVSITCKQVKRPIFRLDGHILDEPYYLFNSKIRLDAVIIERSNVLVSSLPDGKVIVSEDIAKGKGAVVLNNKIIENHHVWKGGFHLSILRPRENPKTSHLRNAAAIRVDSAADFRVLT